MEPFEFETRRQARIHRRLRMIGPGPAAFYRDACRLMADKPVLETTSHLVAHLLREMESALRAVLEPIADSSQARTSAEVFGNGDHKAKIKAIVRALGISETDSVARVWLNLSGKFHRFTHREGLAGPRPVNEGFRQFWVDMDAVLDAVLERFEARYLEIFRVLDEFLEVDRPTKKAAKRLASSVPNNEVALGYFFDRLDDPEWIEPLDGAGLFDHPPRPIRDEEEGTIAFPPWPASRYLARVAANAPEKVLDIALRIETSNARVQAELIDAAVSIPAHLAVELASRAEKWLERPYLLLPSKLSALVSHLARGHEITAASGLTRALLKVESGQHPRELVGEGEGPPLPADPRPRIDIWEYEQFIHNNLPDLVAVAPNETFSLLCDLLEESLDAAKHEQVPEFVDLSEVWRLAIEPHDQNQRYGGIRDLLIDAVRNTAETIIRENPEALHELVVELEARRWTALRRLALYLVRRFGATDLDLVAEKLTDRRIFGDAALHHEYSQLAREFFGRLNSENQETILGWIDEGPDLARYIERVQREQGEPPSEKELAAGNEHWQHRKLAIIKDSLPDQWRQTYNALARKHSEPEMPEFLMWSSGVRMGPTAPKSPDELQAMSIDELVGFLKEWQPPADPMTMDSPEGVSRAFTEAVSQSPTKYAKEAHAFQGLEPTYLRGLIAGLREATRAGRGFDWEPVLQLCAWAIAQPREISGRDPEGSWDQDPHWGWGWKEIAALLEEGLKQSDKGAIPFEMREVVWSVLHPLTDDPEPTLDFEERYGGSNMDPATLSINTTRGRAFHAALEYALWCRSNLVTGAHDDGAESIGSFDDIAEVRDVLEKHLDPAVDPALAIRAVYGWKFSTLLTLDHEWAMANRGAVFPSAQALEGHWRAAWHAFIRFNSPHPTYLQSLRAEHHRAIDQLGEEALSTGWAGNPGERLAEHLMTYYWWGDLSLDSDLLRRFWQEAPEEIRTHAITFVGRSLQNTAGKVSSEVLERLMRLWEMRFANAQAADPSEPFRKELAAFGWWFCSAKMPEVWALDQLACVLDLFREVDPGHMVTDRLASISVEYSAEAITLLDAMIEGDRRGWATHVWRESIHRILQSALASENQEANRQAQDLINRLASRGYLEFRNLLG